MGFGGMEISARWKKERGGENKRLRTREEYTPPAIKTKGWLAVDAVKKKEKKREML